MERTVCLKNEDDSIDDIIDYDMEDLEVATSSGKSSPDLSLAAQSSPSPTSNLNKNSSKSSDITSKENQSVTGMRQPVIHTSNSRTSFTVDDILNPSKFTGSVPNSNRLITRWQPWIMQEAIRRSTSCSLPVDFHLSNYRNFDDNIDGKIVRVIFDAEMTKCMFFGLFIKRFSERKSYRTELSNRFD